MQDVDTRGLHGDRNDGNTAVYRDYRGNGDVIGLKYRGNVGMGTDSALR